MGRVLFGTDGIRGVAGQYPLDARTANALGAALGKWVLESKKEPHVVLGMDTRESGLWLAYGGRGWIGAARCRSELRRRYDHARHCLSGEERTIRGGGDDLRVAQSLRR